MTAPERPTGRVLAHGMSCPACGNPVRVKRDGTLGAHRSNVRRLIGPGYERCRAVGETPYEAGAYMDEVAIQYRDRLLRMRELDEEERRGH